jgi:outer membrane receptor protein involved in Fe transport
MKKFTQELRLSSTFRERFEWELGLFGTHETGPYRVDARAIDTATQQTVGSVLQFTYPPTFNEKAAFAGVTWFINDRMDIQLGGRYSKNKLILDEYAFVGPYTTYALNQPSPFVNARNESETNAFTYLVTPRFRISPDLMVYARLASGYRPGGFNSFVAGVPHTFDPDETQNYELGTKADFLGGTLSVDASLYYIDWSEIQLTVRDPATGFTFSSNGSGAKSEGVELSVTSRPLKGLTISGWVAYDNAVLTEDFPPGPLLGVRGDRLPATPRRSGHISLDQEFPLWGEVMGSLGADVSYVGNRVSYFRATSQRQDLPAYAQTDLRASLRYDTWTVNVFANNVTDRRGVVNGGLGYLPPNAFILIQPRTIGLSATKRF